MAIRARSDNLSLDDPAAAVDDGVTPTPAFTDLWAHREALSQTCYRMVRNAATAEDLVQETYLRALKSGESLERRESLAPWLATVARRRSIDELRRRERLALVGTAPEPVSYTSDDPAQRVVHQELVERLRAAMGTLSPRERQLLLRQASHGVSLAELAAEEDTSVASVRSVLARARQKLRMSLERDGVLGVLPVPGFLRSLRDRLHRWAGRLEGSMPMMAAGGWQLVRLVSAVVVAVATLLGSSLPSSDRFGTDVASLASAVHEEVGAAGVQASVDASSDGGINVGAEASAIVAPVEPGPVPDVELPTFPNEGVDQPEQAAVSDMAASADSTVVFASAVSGTTGQPLLYRSFDRGRSWEKIGSDELEEGQQQRTFRGGRILVPPTYSTDSRVFVLGPAGLQRSDDGGRTFTGIAPAQGQAVLSPNFGSGSERLYISGPPPMAYDAGTRLFQPLGTVPPSVSPGGIAIGPDHATTGEVLVGGMTLAGTTSTPAVFTCTATECSTRALLPALANGPELLVSSTTPTVVLAWARKVLLRSTDGGHTFTPVALPAGFTPLRTTQGQGRLFMVGRNSSGSLSGVLASVDEGLTWTPLGVGTVLEQGAAALVALPDGRLIAAPTTTLGLLCSPDAGSTWAARCPS
jgi:RNA polymerase sigma-70 factor (ECF subfamily)